MSQEKCLCGATNIIFACSGGSNVGQITNQAAIELTKEGKGKMSCIAGVGGHVSGLIASGKGAEKVIAIDGCPVKCVERALQHAEINITSYTLVTDLGIDKVVGELEFSADEINKVKQAVIKTIECTMFTI